MGGGSRDESVPGSGLGEKRTFLKGQGGTGSRCGEYR